MKHEKHGLQIVVIDNGFVYIGDVECDDKWLAIAGARSIRKWGTTKGLGQLRNGPTKDTVLDETVEVLVPLSRVVHLIKVNPDAWVGKL